MSDIIERAEAALKRGEWCRTRGLARSFPKQVLTDLIAELKRLDQENAQLHCRLQDLEANDA